MEIDYFRLARDRYFVPVVAKVPGSELEAARQGRRGNHAHRIHRPGEGRQGQGGARTCATSADVKLKGEAAGQLAKHPLVYPTGFTLAPGAYDLKFLVRDNETGKMGTYETKFVIPDLTTEPKLLPISSVILSSQRMDPNAAVFSAERDKKLMALNPLIQDGKQLVPSVTRVFNKSQEMFVYLEAYEPAGRYHAAAGGHA